MNRSLSSMVIILSLLMVLLTLGAAFLFLLQGRQMLVAETAVLDAEVATLESDTTRLVGEVVTAENVREQTINALATVEDTRNNLAGELTRSAQDWAMWQTEMDDLNANLTTLSATATAEAEEAFAIANQPPQIAILLPQDGTAVLLNEPLTFVIVASHPQGLTAVNLTIGDEQPRNYPTNDETLLTITDEWTPTQMGSVTFSLMAINVRGVASSPVTVTIQVLDPLMPLADDPLAEVRTAVEQNVIAIRGLQPQAPITPTLLNESELRTRLETDLTADTTPEDARHDALVLAAFDFVPRDFDLYTAMINLYTEQVAGFYDPETDEFVVISDDDELDVLEQWTHAHEYVHALQDQHFDLGRLTDDGSDSEAQIAFRALAEGEATLVQLRYLYDGYFSPAEMETLMAALMAEGVAGSIPDDLPPIFMASLAFPYEAGLEFVLAIYNGGNMYAGGDFTAVDALWQNPPISTEQILHPEKYQAGDVPQIVTLPPLTDTLGAGWQLIEEDVFGEFYLRQYLAQQLTESLSSTAAAGWGGDRYAVYWHDEDEALAFLFRLAWDSGQDGMEFTAIYPRYLNALYATEAVVQADDTRCWSGEDTICFRQYGEEHLIARAPDVATAVRLLTAGQDQ